MQTQTTIKQTLYLRKNCLKLWQNEEKNEKRTNIAECLGHFERIEIVSIDIIYCASTQISMTLVQPISLVE